MTEKTFLDDAASVTVPTMVVQNRNDPWTSLPFVETYYDKLSGEKEMLWLDLAKKRAAAYDYLGTNPTPFSNFFAKYM